MKNTLLAIIAASSLAFASCSGKVEYKNQPSQQQLEEQVQIEKNSELEKRLKNPLEGKEAYELGPAGNYQCHLEDNLCCLPPFYKFGANEGTLYLVKTDSDNSFKKPIKPFKDDYDQYKFDLGKYEVWLENRGFYAPIGSFVAENKEKYILKVYELKPDNSEKTDFTPEPPAPLPLPPLADPK